VTVHRDKFLIMKPTRCTNFSIFILGIKLYMFRTVSLSIIRSFSLYTQQWRMSYRFADNLRAGSGWNFSSILILIPDQRNYPKHVEFYSKKKLRNLCIWLILLQETRYNVIEAVMSSKNNLRKSICCLFYKYKKQRLTYIRLSNWQTWVQLIWAEYHIFKFCVPFCYAYCIKKQPYRFINFLRYF
jgi:hypothetical protein